jgi:hypothetical protein
VAAVRALTNQPAARSIRASWQAEPDALLEREKAHTHEGDGTVTLTQRQVVIGRRGEVLGFAPSN